MSKEKTTAESEAALAERYHGYTAEQIKKMEDSRDDTAPVEEVEEEQSRGRNKHK